MLEKVYTSLFKKKEQNDNDNSNQQKTIISGINADEQKVGNDNPELWNTAYGNTYKPNEYGWNLMSIEELNALLTTENEKRKEKKEKQKKLDANKEVKKTEYYDDYNNPTKNTDVTYKNGYNSKTWENENEEIGYKKCYRHISDLEQYIKHREQSKGGKSRRKKKRTKKSKKSKKSKRKRSRKARK